MSYRILCAESNTPKWMQLRKSGIGASEAAAILGDTNWGSPLTVWQDKRSPKVEDIGTERMRWGHLLEPAIRDEVGRMFPQLGKVIPSEGLLQSVEYPWLLGTLDAMIDSPDYGIVPLEIKNVSGFQKRDWFDGDGVLRVPPKYTVQVRQQAFIRDDAPGGWVGVLFDGNELEVLWVPRSQEFIDTHLIGTLGHFWQHNVIEGNVPDPIYGDDLRTQWEVIDGETIEADDTAAEMVERWRDAKVREKEVREDIELMKNYFGIYTILDGTRAASAITDQRGNVLLKMQKRSGQHRVNVATHAAHHPDCTECVTKDRDSYSPNAVPNKQGTK